MATLSTHTPDISIIIVHYQTPEITSRLINKIGDHADCEIILVDNSPPANISDLIKTKKYTYLPQDTNLGYSGGINQGIQASRGEWIIILNSDIATDYQSVRKLIDIARHNEARAATPRLVDTQGQSLATIGWYDSLTEHPLNYIFMRPRIIKPIFESSTHVDIAYGAVMALHRSVIDTVGLFDQKTYFMYFEDLDYAYRMYQHSISYLYVPEVTMRHHVSQSLNQDAAQKKKYYKDAKRAFITKYRGPVIYMLNEIIGYFK